MEPCAESEMGKSERSCSFGETQTHHVGISPQEDRGGTKKAVGEAEGRKEGRVAVWDLLRQVCGRFSYFPSEKISVETPPPRCVP